MQKILDAVDADDVGRAETLLQAALSTKGGGGGGKSHIGLRAAGALIALRNDQRCEARATALALAASATLLEYPSAVNVVTHLLQCLSMWDALIALYQRLVPQFPPTDTAILENLVMTYCRCGKFAEVQKTATTLFQRSHDLRHVLWSVIANVQLATAANDPSAFQWKLAAKTLHDRLLVPSSSATFTSEVAELFVYVLSSQGAHAQVVEFLLSDRGTSVGVRNARLLHLHKAYCALEDWQRANAVAWFLWREEPNCYDYAAAFLDTARSASSPMPSHEGVDMPCATVVDACPTVSISIANFDTNTTTTDVAWAYAPDAVTAHAYARAAFQRETAERTGPPADSVSAPNRGSALAYLECVFRQAYGVVPFGDRVVSSGGADWFLEVTNLRRQMITPEHRAAIRTSLGQALRRYCETFGHKPLCFLDVVKYVVALVAWSLPDEPVHAKDVVMVDATAIHPADVGQEGKATGRGRPGFDVNRFTKQCLRIALDITIDEAAATVTTAQQPSGRSLQRHVDPSSSRDTGSSVSSQSTGVETRLSTLQHLWLAAYDAVESSLTETEESPADLALLLACNVCAIEATKAELDEGRQRWARRGLSFALQSPRRLHHPGLSLFGATFASMLSAHDPAFTDALDLKSVQRDTMSHIGLWPAIRCFRLDRAQTAVKSGALWYSLGSKEVGDVAGKCFSQGAPSKLSGVLDFQRRMQQSVVRSETAILRLSLFATDFDTTDEAAFALKNAAWSAGEVLVEAMGGGKGGLDPSVGSSWFVDNTDRYDVWGPYVVALPYSQFQRRLIDGLFPFGAAMPPLPQEEAGPSDAIHSAAAPDRRVALRGTRVLWLNACIVLITRAHLWLSHSAAARHKGKASKSAATAVADPTGTSGDLPDAGVVPAGSYAAAMDVIRRGTASTSRSGGFDELLGLLVDDVCCPIVEGLAAASPPTWTVRRDRVDAWLERPAMGPSWTSSLCNEEDIRDAVAADVMVNLPLVALTLRLLIHVPEATAWAKRLGEGIRTFREKCAELGGPYNTMLFDAPLTDGAASTTSSSAAAVATLARLRVDSRNAFVAHMDALQRDVGVVAKRK